ncbi:OLC1v1012276C2 [Oldenlandia corymbosa var. corymbosa]|nr:OLC1v1012276C2 [Oldenlandia corymbosa var. corymbosa]
MLNLDEGKDKITNNDDVFHSPRRMQSHQSSCYMGSIQAEVLAPSIKEELYLLSAGRHLNYGGTICFHRVPEKYRAKNKDAYDPRLVSIGFIHHGESQLRGMEEYKFKYLYHFLQTFQVNLDELASYVQSQEKFLCDCYEDNPLNNPAKQSNLHPYEVILLDGIFIVELFLKNHFPGMREKGDIIFNQPWVSKDIRHDLLLFENQLPLQFLATLYNTFVAGQAIKCLDDDATFYPPPFIKLAHQYFKDVGFRGNQLLITQDFHNVRDFIEFLSILHTPNAQQLAEINARRVKTTLAAINDRQGRKKLGFARCPTATELKAAGVEFRSGKGKNLLDVDFDRKRGILTLPSLIVNDSAEAFFRSLIAFEQSPYHPKFITSYVCLLDYLIDTEKDVDLLIKHGIIISDQLHSSNKVADSFNDLYKELLTNPKDFYFDLQCHELRCYTRDFWHFLNLQVTRGCTIAQRDYLKNPLDVFNIIHGVIFLLGLTLVQTVCSVLQLKMAKT